MSLPTRRPWSPLAYRVRDVAVRSVRAVAFWTGALLPLAYVPLLVLLEQERIAGLDLLTSLVALNVVALAVGHGHEPGRGDERENG